MRRLLQTWRGTSAGTGEGNLLYGTDPGDASTEYYYHKLQEEIREGITHLRAYPNEGPREKERFLAQAMLPGRRRMQPLLALVLAAMGAGRKP